MRKNSKAACCLLLLAPFVYLHARESVEVLSTQKSYQRVRLSRLVGGSPQKGVKVELYRDTLSPGEETKPLFSMTSDEDGNVVTPVLPLENYHLIAASGVNLRADLYLEVSRKSKRQSSFFPLILLESHYPTPEQMWSTADESPVKDRLGVFSGTVYDPSGAVVWGVSVTVVKKGTKGKEQVAQLKSASDGKFSKQLREGAYIALFSTPGFQIAYVPFEVTNQGSGELRVTLQLGSASQAETVTELNHPGRPAYVANDQRARTND